MIAALLAFTAVSRATLIWRTISAAPSADLRNGCGEAGQDGPRSGLGVQRVTLAIVAPFPAIAMTHLDDTECLTPHIARQSHSVRARPLDTKGLDVTERARPRQQLRVASAIGGRRCSSPAEYPRRSIATATWTNLCVSTPTMIAVEDGLAGRSSVTCVGPLRSDDDTV